MECTLNIELFLQLEKDSSNLESFSINPKDKLQVLWTYLQSRYSDFECLTVIGSKKRLDEDHLDQTIQELGIQTNTTLKIRLSKPEAFLVNANGPKKVKIPEKSGEERTRIAKGINVRGKCMNSKCSSYKKPVIFQIGYTRYDVISKLAESKCPICKEFFDPDTFIYFDCLYQVKGVYIDKSLKVNSKITIDPQDAWETTEKKKVHSYAPDASGTKAWLELVITAKPIEEEGAI